MEKIWIKKELYILNYEFLKFYAFFSDFYLIYKFNFYLKIRKKGVTYLQALTWRAGPGGGWRGARVRLGVRRGTEATWQSPDGPHGAQVALTRGRRPHGRGPRRRLCGRHVAGR